jgi:hypothetical protein
LLHRWRVRPACLTRLLHLSAAARRAPATWRLRQHRAATQCRSDREIPHSYSTHCSSPCCFEIPLFEIQALKMTSDTADPASGIALLK